PGHRWQDHVQRHRRPGPSNPNHERRRPPHQDLLHPKKVGTLPVDGDAEAVKQTNEIATAIPLLDAIDIKHKEITADALLTQRKLAEYLVVERSAHYYFTVKANQPTLEQDIALHFKDRQQPDFVEFTPPDHGRIETRKKAYARASGRSKCCVQNRNVGIRSSSLPSERVRPCPKRRAGFQSP